LMTDDERRKRTRIKVANWRRKNHVRLTHERHRASAARLHKTLGRPPQFRLIELFDADGAPADCMIHRVTDPLVLPDGTHSAVVLIPPFPMSKMQCYSWRRYLRKFWKNPPCSI
jgi:hypothetical protein